MNTEAKLRAEREVTKYPSKGQKFREHQIQKLAAENGLDWETANKLYEYELYRGTQLVFSACVGGFFAWKLNPVRNTVMARNPFMRKSWMQLPIQAAAFVLFTFGAAQMQTRFFPKFQWANYVNYKGGVQGYNYLNNPDLVQKFRFFDGHMTAASSEQELQAYIDKYTYGPLTKDSVLNKIADGRPLGEHEAFLSNFKFKRNGRDKDDLFYTLGKIHGVEYLAYATEEELNNTPHHPIALQRLANKIMDEKRVQPHTSFDDMVFALERGLKEYKESLDKEFAGNREFHPSDYKKLLALPYYLAKRRELAEPKKGQVAWNLFEVMYGKAWDHYDGVKFDPEEKITEFNYEKFIPQAILKTMDTESEEFKLMIKERNFNTKTQFEQHKANQESFKKLMPHLAHLQGKEALDFIHLVMSKQGTTLDADQQRSLDLIDAACSDEQVKALAKASEEENFNLKSYHRLENRHLRFADKKKMPIDARKVKDLLANKHLYRAKVGAELPTYLMQMEDNQLQKGIMTYMLETAYGKKKDLLGDIGLAKSTNKFLSYTDYRKMQDDALVNPTDGQLANLLQARFTQIDLTDYDHTYDGPEEHPDVLVLDPGYVIPFRTDDAAKSDLLLEEFELEEIENPAVGPFHREIHTAQADAIEAAMRAEAEEEIVIDADMFPDIDFDDDDDDEEEKEEIELQLSDGLTTADGFFQPTEEPEEEENEEGIQRVQKATYLEGMEDVVGAEHIREKFNNPEIDAFLKLLNVKPHAQWEDASGYHYKAATHVYEDEAQELDPYYHMVAEVERKHMERQQVQEFRRGTEIKFLLDPKKRPVFHKN